MKTSEAFNTFETACIRLGARTEQEIAYQLVLGFVSNEVVNDMLEFAADSLTDVQIAAIKRGYAGNLPARSMRVINARLELHPFTLEEIEDLYDDAHRAEFGAEEWLEDEWDDDFDGPSIIDDDLSAFTVGPESLDFEVPPGYFAEDDF